MVLVLGVLFLLRDLNVWGFWNVSWWTAMFLVAGMIMYGSTCCPECQTACCDMPAKGKKK